MSFTELLEKVVTLTSDERKELIAAIQEAERQDRRKSAQDENGAKPQSFAEAAADIIGSVDSGLGDLSTNKKYMEGFGRDRNRNY